MHRVSLSLSKPHHLCRVSGPHGCTGTLTADSLPVEKSFQFVFLLSAVRFVRSWHTVPLHLRFRSKLAKKTMCLWIHHTRKERPPLPVGGSVGGMTRGGTHTGLAVSGAVRMSGPVCRALSGRFFLAKVWT